MGHGWCQGPGAGWQTSWFTFYKVDAIVYLRRASCFKLSSIDMCGGCMSVALLLLCQMRDGFRFV